MKSFPPESLVFIHLSDIHFCKQINAGVYDLDEDIRNEIEIDITRLVSEVGSVAGIVVSGDIAFSGRREEYQIARAWLDKLCNIVQCPTTSVMVTPGNHDVDRSVVEQNKIIDITHKELRTCPKGEINKIIYKLVQNPNTKDILYQPIQTYLSNLASFYGCEIGPERPFWERDFKLNDGSILRFRGINSTLVSDRYDDDAFNKLVVGDAQAIPQRISGVTYAILCHHPPAWLREQDSLEDVWNARVALQLFGHKHRHRIRLQDNKTVIITSGATHPERREIDWKPFYALTRLWIDRRSDNRELAMQVYPRIWNNESNAFEPWYNDKGEPCRFYHLPLAYWVTNDTPGKKSVRILIADDFFATREGLRTAIETIDGFEVAGEASTILELFSMVESLTPDIVIIDLKWFNDEQAGQYAIKNIKGNLPNIKFVAVTAHENLIKHALQAGADAGLTKTFSKKNLIDVLVDLSKEA